MENDVSNPQTQMPPPPIIPDKYSSLALSDLKANVHEGDNVCDFTLVGSTKKPTAPKEKEKWR